ncbi:hypothetical protein [Flavobacterium aciduliphilum]|uniref:Uncharacterized protein n=1 Tax=Flavobacterium aciduliphilum TaxID=1101402 RepID=A0A328YUL2_9FLAO|nr:hypothetical protein [Flavobacterium aciduliphilum]RAR74237.1 hypothetical protein CLV55_102170 [Flavobacterium aciduliphilum]
MVRIVNYQKRTTEEGKVFFTLELQGGIEVVKSQETGKLYMTARKANMSCTFDELTCQSLIGTELPGTVRKVECEEYSYTIKDTGEIITLSHRFEYVEQEAHIQTPEKSKTTIEEFMSNAPTGNTFSTNGQLVH